jgi:DNA-binding HxlR family transcriptional regulator
MAKRNKQLRIECPFEAAMDVISGKWKGLIVYRLMAGAKRFNELKQLIPAISQRMLSQQLKELEADGLLLREVYPETPPRVEYRLSPKGKSLQEAFIALKEWGKQL